MKWKLKDVSKDTDNRFLNYYTLRWDVDGKEHVYYMASRNDEAHLKPLTGDFDRPDAVMCPLYYVNPEDKEIYVLVTKQFRPAIGGIVYSMVAGLLDPGDASVEEAVRREALEEAGAIVEDTELLCPTSPTSSGLSDECNAMVLGRIKGFVHNDLEEFEDINTELVKLRDIKKMMDDPDKHFALMARLAYLYLYERFIKD